MHTIKVTIRAGANMLVVLAPHCTDLVLSVFAMVTKYVSPVTRSYVHCEPQILVSRFFFGATSKLQLKLLRHSQGSTVIYESVTIGVSDIIIECNYIYNIYRHMNQ